MKSRMHMPYAPAMLPLGTNPREGLKYVQEDVFTVTLLNSKA